MSQENPTASQLIQAIVAGKVKEAPALTETLLAENMSAADIMNTVLIPAMEIVGDKFEKKEYFVPEVLVSAMAMHKGLAILRPLLAQARIAMRGRIVMGTVKGDLHDIGKNIVCMILESGGYEVFDLGADCPADRFVDAVKKHDAHIVGMSTLLTTTRPEMELVVKTLAKEKMRDKVKVIVGGAAVSERFAASVGADAYAANANEALRQINRFMNGDNQ